VEGFVTSRRMATIKGARTMGADIVDGSEVEINEGQLEPGEEWTARDFDPHATTGFPRQVRA